VAQLTLQQRQHRLLFDYRVAMEMRTPFVNVTAYRDADDLKQRRNPIVAEQDAHLASQYLVDYFMKALIGPDKYSDKTSVKFDLLAGGNYPYTQPSCFVESAQMPWTPHFSRNRPICTDEEIWLAAKGRLLLGHWLVHVAKLLNFDEIPRTENYGGYNPDAAAYWRTKLNGQPLTPDFPYPVLPPWISSEPVNSFEAFDAEALFEATPVQSQIASEQIDPDFYFEPESSFFSPT
jgi:hypothetical protein